MRIVPTQNVRMPCRRTADAAVPLSDASYPLAVVPRGGRLHILDSKTSGGLVPGRRHPPYRETLTVAEGEGFEPPVAHHHGCFQDSCHQPDSAIPPAVAVQSTGGSLTSSDVDTQQ